MSDRCDTCNDTHRMWHPALSRDVPCTQCPTPCRDCASHGGRGAYCAVANCSCECHHWLGANTRGIPVPDPATRDELLALLRRWRELEPDPRLDDTGGASADHEAWSAAYQSLTDATDRVLVAELRQPGKAPE